ncbi:MAG: Bax inhibitor-1/YccA family protein [Alphaproteobacteria bacterium]|nr:Bax inhibitor-1/YccA family protein [Alphaproteobacteria bacterium]
MQDEILERTGGEVIDQGLREYMQKIYGYMAGGLLLTALSAYLVLNTALFNVFFSVSNEGVDLSVWGWVALLAPFVLLIFANRTINNGTKGQMQMMFWTFAALEGIGLAPICLLYTGASLTRVFLITACSFGGLCLWGYTTKRDLSGMGAFLRMGLIGLIVALIVNLFMQSSAFDWCLSIIGVGIFGGLTAYDTAMYRQVYHPADDSEMTAKKAISGALALYLDFLNMFLYLLRLLGDRR